ncbi:MAG: uroporphyrinogen decarboxylase [Anaerolineae bacterium]
MNDRFLKACRREPVDRTPIWLMRQAGRYMAEYRALRERYDILTLCRTPELAVEVTLQPIKRFDLDAAILFSDIMIILRGMGIEFDIRESQGPLVANPVVDLPNAEAVRVLDPEEGVPYVLEAIRLLRQELEGKLPLIGFAGAPFTLASYVIEGKGSRDLYKAKCMMHCDPETWRLLMSKLADSIAAYLLAQIEAGVQAVQLFDSWVGALSPRDYVDFVLPYSKRVFDKLAGAGVPCIHFGTGTATLLELMKQAGGDVIGLDWRAPLSQGWQRLGEVALQGNLDPVIMLTAPDIVETQARAVLDEARGHVGHIFNLGHGILPGTPLENVDRLIEVVHNYR